jgi:poly(3-hydroxybutyrate) depolymerase
VIKLAIACALVGALGVLQTPATPEQDVTEKLSVNGIDRSYRVFVPADVGKSGPAPAVVLFNGSGSPVDGLWTYWKPLAQKEGIVLIAPGAFARGSWQMPQDSPEFSMLCVEAVKAKYPIDQRRVYLFGHSGGAGHVLLLGLFESEYYAAAAAHAGVLTQDNVQFLDLAKRKMPYAIWVGTKDRMVPLEMARATEEVLLAKGFSIKLTEWKDHTHSYAERGEEVTTKAWEFLKKQKLPSDPKYYKYTFNPPKK